MSDETTAFPSGDRSSDPHREDARRMQRVLDSHYGHRFQVDRVIGRGGMSTVWLASDSGTGAGTGAGAAAGRIRAGHRTGSVRRTPYRRRR